jgi:hypothetical protein
MADSVVRGLAAHQDLYQLFQTDPLGALQQLEQRTGQKFTRINAGDIAVIQSLTFDEFQALIALSDKVKAAGVDYFKVGGSS